MSDRPVRIGLQLQPQHMDYPTIRRTAAEAGVDVLFATGSSGVTRQQKRF